MKNRKRFALKLKPFAKPSSKNRIIPVWFTNQLLQVREVGSLVRQPTRTVLHMEQKNRSFNF